MAYHLESIDIYLRPLPPGRMRFVLGKSGRNAKPEPKKNQAPKGKVDAGEKNRRPGAFLVTRVRVSDDAGNTATGVSGDRPSYGWLDKRPDFTGPEKLARLFDLIKKSREVYLVKPDFDSPFAAWHRSYEALQGPGKAANHEAVTISFAASLFERAIVDAVCKLQNVSVHQAVKRDLLGLDLEAVSPELKNLDLPKLVLPRPRVRFHVRHTVGGADPLTAEDWPPENRINDGEPETLEEYVSRDGVRFFKVKISGDPAGDLDRLRRIWQVVQKANEPVITLDGNESYDDIESFSKLVESIESADEGLFQHLLFIEQPMPRRLTHDPATAPVIQKIAAKKPLVIDEADGFLGAFPQAFEIGYSGVSHKNCKGFFKSLINLAWCHHFEATTDREAFMSGEDLSNMPIIPIQQDFAALGILGIEHTERNGHHYTYGLPFLTKNEKSQLREHHPDLYTGRDGEMFLDIQDGAVMCPSIQIPGFGVAFEPDWDALVPLEEW
ncbi:MAG: hypothetical protein HKN23_08570 [Verrucomicrobiales bacterium]|nr:hypothetical protein [Verrucomicrobiales bacterium]